MKKSLPLLFIAVAQFAVSGVAESAQILKLSPKGTVAALELSESELVTFRESDRIVITDSANKSYKGSVREIKKNKLVFVSDKKLTSVKSGGQVKITTELARNEIDELNLEDGSEVTTSKPSKTAVNKPDQSQEFLTNNYNNPLKNSLWSTDDAFPAAMMLRTNKSLFLGKITTESGSLTLKEIPEEGSEPQDDDDSNENTELKNTINGSSVSVTGIYAAESGLKIGARIAQEEATFKRKSDKTKVGNQTKTLMLMAPIKDIIGLGAELDMTELSVKSNSSVFSSILPSFSLMMPRFDVVFSYKSILYDEIKVDEEDSNETTKTRLYKPEEFRVDGGFLLNEKITLTGGLNRLLLRSISSKEFKDIWGLSFGAIIKATDTLSFKASTNYLENPSREVGSWAESESGFDLSGSARLEFAPGHAGSAGLNLYGDSAEGKKYEYEMESTKMIFGYEASF